MCGEFNFVCVLPRSVFLFVPRLHAIAWLHLHQKDLGEKLDLLEVFAGHGAVTAGVRRLHCSVAASDQSVLPCCMLLIAHDWLTLPLCAVLELWQVSGRTA